MLNLKQDELKNLVEILTRLREFLLSRADTLNNANGPSHLPADAVRDSIGEYLRGAQICTTVIDVITSKDKKTGIERCIKLAKDSKKANRQFLKKWQKVLTAIDRGRSVEEALALLQ